MSLTIEHINITIANKCKTYYIQATQYADNQMDIGYV